jgi:hypothetical protein
MSVRLLAAAAVAALTLALAGTASAATTPPRTSPTLKLSTKNTMTTDASGVQHYHYAYGPIHIAPGQNSIFFDPNDLKPKIPGFITRFAPNLIESDGTIPRVDVIHLHHAVWLVNNQPTFGAGEEKTLYQTPKGYGYPYKPSDVWTMNHMIHNLTPSPDTVYITYDLDFVPASLPAAQSLIPVHTWWLDAVGGLYPVFDALKGTGHGSKAKRRFTFPDDSTTAPHLSWTVRKNMTLVGTAGHLHPGGLYTDLKVRRGNQTKLLFHSVAKYWEPAGAVSWDVAMTATQGNWKINLKPGDVITVSGTYDTSKASWYESMAIMATQVADGWHGVDPFTSSFPTTGQVTHGPLAENRNHGGQSGTGLPNPLKVLDGPIVTNKTIPIKNFVYGQGDLTGLGNGVSTNVPVVKQGGKLTFRNDDAPAGLTGAGQPSGGNLPIFHTITACKSPCNKSTGIAYPIANGKGDYDSGELGYGQQPAANTNTWAIPPGLKPGTYTYFCRIHPFMRGAFRVVSAAKLKHRKKSA